MGSAFYFLFSFNELFKIYYKPPYLLSCSFFNRNSLTEIERYILVELSYQNGFDFVSFVICVGLSGSDQLFLIRYCYSTKLLDRKVKHKTKHSFRKEYPMFAWDEWRHIFVCQGCISCLYLRCFYWILGLFRQFFSILLHTLLTLPHVSYAISLCHQYS